MQIVDKETHRVLAYVDALNRHGVRPSRQMVNEFAANPKQKYREDNVFGMSARAAIRTMFDVQKVVAETFCQYMARLSWINEEPVDAVELTAVGRALLQSLNSPVMTESAADVFEVVLSPDNPFAYAQALSGLSSVKQALLVEPYFRLEQLMDIAEFDNIVRVMVGSKLKRRDYELLATGLGSVPEGRSIEIRKAPDLHDRYLIPADDGHVVMLGASLGGIGKKVSTMTTLGEVASIALREAHEQLWRGAEVIEPKKPTAPPADPPAETKEDEAASSGTPPTKSAATKATAKKAPAKKSSAPLKAQD